MVGRTANGATEGLKPATAVQRCMPDTNVGGKDRLLRAVLAVVSTVVAVHALRGGRRKIGAVA